MFERGKERKEIEVMPIFGINEISAVTAMPTTEALEMVNFRISRDGTRIEKRNGIELLASGFNDPIYGYKSYYDDDDKFCQLVVTKNGIWRKIGNEDWIQEVTYSSVLNHPVKIHEVNKKVFVIREGVEPGGESQNYVFHSNGLISKAGIKMPSTLPTLSASFDTTLLNEEFTSISGWSDEDAGNGESSQATFDGKSCLKLLTTGSSGDVAARSKVISGITSVLGVEFSVYFDELGIYQDSDYFEIQIYNGRVCTKVRIDKNDIYVWDGACWVAAYTDIQLDKWITLKFYINTNESGKEYIEIYKDGQSVGDFWITNTDTTNTGKVYLGLSGSSVATCAYIDYIKIGNAQSGNITGLRRYAVAFGRGGNYPSMSRAIKSYIGSPTFYGTGLNDLTVGGEYTGAKNLRIVVKIDSVGSVDTIKWSEDGGSTWNSTNIPITETIYLPYGIELYFESTTGHTLNDYWIFEVNALAIDAVHQKITISDLPISTDPQVNQRLIFRTLAGGTTYYLVAVINDNSSTTFVDNIPDTALSIELEEDYDEVPPGKYSCWWDNRLWIADDEENIIYYSKLNYPDAFDIANNWIAIKSGSSDDKIMNIIPFKSYLFVFTKRTIRFIRKRDDGTYGLFDCESTHCLKAPHSLIEIAGLLCYLSDRGVETFNGCAAFPNPISKYIERTIKSIDYEKAEQIIAVNNKNKDELMIAIPYIVNSTEHLIIVCNYTSSRPVFYLFKYPERPSLLVETLDESGNFQIYMGTEDGNLYKIESGTNDNGENISAEIRTPWIREDKYKYWRHLEIEYELPDENATLDLSLYVNFEAQPQRTKSFAGYPSPITDKEIRLPIKNQMEMALRGQFLSIAISNDDDIGSDLKINYIKLIYFGLVRKLEIMAGED